VKTIFLVDDSLSIRNIVKGSLVREYNVVEAEHGQDALDKIAGGATADLFLLDVNMPVMDGLALLGKIKAQPKFAKTPVLMLTTETKPERRQEAKTLGASGWILKPCDPDQLLAALKTFL
jgi:two-component system chemotaxis response regulator CheY